MIENIDQKILGRFEIIQKIRKTNSGVVWKAIDRKANDVVAIKKVNPAQVSAAQLIKILRDTLTLLDFPSHNSIIKIRAVIKSEAGDWYFIYDFVDMDLQTLIKVRILSEFHQKAILYNIAKTLLNIHLGRTLHCDLSPSKVLVDPECNIKLIGFGFVQDLDSTEENAPLNDYSKERHYRAPEILLGATHLTEKVDVWSLGCIFGEMMTSEVLFNGNSTLNQLERIVELMGKPSENESMGSEMAESILYAVQSTKIKSFQNIFPKSSEKALDLLKSMLQFHPELRISLAEVLNHPYLIDMKESSLFDVRYLHCQLQEKSTEPLKVPDTLTNKFLTSKDYVDLILFRLGKKRHIHIRTQRDLLFQSNDQQAQLFSQRNNNNMRFPLIRQPVQEISPEKKHKTYVSQKQICNSPKMKSEKSINNIFEPSLIREGKKQ